LRNVVVEHEEDETEIRKEEKEHGHVRTGRALRRKDPGRSGPGTATTARGQLVVFYSSFSVLQAKLQMK
jgi:hypothetical protein